MPRPNDIGAQCLTPLPTSKIMAHMPRPCNIIVCPTPSKKMHTNPNALQWPLTAPAMPPVASHISPNKYIYIYICALFQTSRALKNHSSGLNRNRTTWRTILNYLKPAKPWVIRRNPATSLDWTWPKNAQSARPHSTRQKQPMPCPPRPLLNTPSLAKMPRRLGAQLLNHLLPQTPWLYRYLKNSRDFCHKIYHKNGILDCLIFIRLPYGNFVQRTSLETLLTNHCCDETKTAQTRTKGKPAKKWGEGALEKGTTAGPA